MRETIWLGLDVHATTITIAKFIGQAAKEDQVWTVPNEPATIRRSFLRLEQEGDLRCCYEAGACGYELYRQLAKMEIECTVVAPSLIPSKPGDKVKTDRRDAVKLGRFLRAGELVSVRVPTVEQEEARDLVRARESVRRDRTAARQRLGKFLLRHGRRYGATGWTGKHTKWLEAQEFTGTARRVFDHYREQVRYLDEQLAGLEREIYAMAQTPAFKAVVDRLCCLRGIAVLGAMVLVSELYDLRRFSHPRQLMAFLGLVPRENSSSDRQRRGRITKTGNAHARRIVIEAAWTYRYRHRSGGSPRLRRALVGQPAEVVAMSRKASQRLSQRYARLVGRGKTRPHACTSVARELCGFLWAIAKDETTATNGDLTQTR